jgi:hypothetical protein
MSDSVLGLGVASLGAAAMGVSRAVRKARKYKQEQGTRMVKTPMPSQQDYRLGLAAAQSKKPGMQESVLGASGNFYYGEAPKRIPQGSYLVPGPSIAGFGGYTNPQSGYSTSQPISTYQLITPTATTQQQTQAVRSPINLGAGKSTRFFGGADYKEARAQGYSNKEILGFLQENQSFLRNRHAPGGGGIYDKIKQKVGAQEAKRNK